MAGDFAVVLTVSSAVVYRLVSDPTCYAQGFAFWLLLRLPVTDRFVREVGLE